MPRRDACVGLPASQAAQHACSASQGLACSQLIEALATEREGGPCRSCLGQRPCFLRGLTTCLPWRAAPMAQAPASTHISASAHQHARQRARARHCRGLLVGCKITSRNAAMTTRALPATHAASGLKPQPYLRLRMALARHGGSMPRGRRSGSKQTRRRDSTSPHSSCAVPALVEYARLSPSAPAPHQSQQLSALKPDTRKRLESA